jgi:hypothetical protein
MDWLKQLVPMIGTALGGPLGGAAATFVASKLGLNSDTIEAVTDVLNSGKMTAEQVANLKLAELDFQKFMADNKIKEEDLSVRNTQGARDMQTATHSNIPGALAIIIVLGFFGILLGMMFGWLKVSDQQSLLILLGALSAGFGAVLNFYFGSSHGSQNKDVLLAASQPLNTKQ